ncbi:MAG: tRNA threonylcarbamoyladenosine dehydratase [Erysipelotrichaceae bacterium]|nr:tRNA threonylcarbamoyladenosine dehydratase [Erysipelotrichaceae bacterium]
MKDRLSRTEILLGKEAMDKIADSRVAVFGIGGVGGYAMEALARSGIGTLDIIDSDRVAASNLNRQIIATRDTIGQLKVDVAKKRINDIDPDIVVNTYDCFYLPEERDGFPFGEYDFIVDAIDTVTAKIDLIFSAKEFNVPIISAMGCGNRIDPTQIRIGDLYKTSGDPLAKVMRRELRKKGIKKLTVVYSLEKPIEPIKDSEAYISQMNDEDNKKRSVPGSTAFVPAAAGLAMASYVIRELIRD